MSELNEQLLPCPFCNGQPMLVEWTASPVEIKCEACGIWMDGLREEVIAAWNRRAPAPQAAPSGLESYTGARLRIVCRMLGITELPDSNQSVYEAAFTLLGTVRRELEKRAAVTQAAPSEPVRECSLNVEVGPGKAMRLTTPFAGSVSFDGVDEWTLPATYKQLVRFVQQAMYAALRRPSIPAAGTSGCARCGAVANHDDDDGQ